MDKHLISPPTNFKHTFHLGNDQAQSGQLELSKLKTAMTDIVGTLQIELPTTVPDQPTPPQPAPRITFVNAVPVSKT